MHPEAYTPILPPLEPEPSHRVMTFVRAVFVGFLWIAGLS
jgi:hypothetical protein